MAIDEINHAFSTAIIKKTTKKKTTELYRKCSSYILFAM